MLLITIVWSVFLEPVCPFEPLLSFLGLESRSLMGLWWVVIGFWPTSGDTKQTAWPSELNQFCEDFISNTASFRKITDSYTSFHSSNQHLYFSGRVVQILIWNYWLLLSVYLHKQIIEAQCKKQMNLCEKVISSKRDYFVLVRYASTIL